MKKQTDRLSVEKIRGQGPKEIFGENAQMHEMSVHDISTAVFDALKEKFPNLEFRFRKSLEKHEINKKLNEVDARLGVTIFLEDASIRPDGGIIEVRDDHDKWRIVLVSEAKHQGKDIENIRKGVLVGKNKDQELMVAGNAIERSHKNINEIRNIMIDEKHFPYVLFLQGSNFITEPITVLRPGGSEVVLYPNNGVLNRIDRLTAANYSLPINQNCCENMDITIDGQTVMLQAVSIYAKATEWTNEEMFRIMMEVSLASLRVIGLAARSGM